MSFEEEFLSMMPHEVTVQKAGASTGTGHRTYGTAKTYRARIEHDVRTVRNAQGEEVVSNTVVYLNTTDEIQPDDLLTLPSGFIPRKPPIITIGRVSDEDGLHHTVVRL
jgi:hypothetical protein